MPDFFVPRNLLKYLQADQASTHTRDIVLGDVAAAPAERSRLTTLRTLVQGDDTSALLAEVDLLDQGIRQGLAAMQMHKTSTADDQRLLEASMATYQAILDGLDQIRQGDSTTGMMRVEEAVQRLDQLLSPPPPSVDIPM